jgi:hypothetical protein
MSPLSARRILTALTLAILLCAAPAFAQAPARTIRTAHAVAAPSQLGILDVFQNAIAHFIAKITVSGGGGGGGVAGPRIDPEGHTTSPGGTPPPVGTP